MFQYLPDFRAERDPVLGRPLDPREREEALEMARHVGVNLYNESDGYRDDDRAAVREEPAGVDTIEGAVDIIIHDDGRVGFSRLLGDLVPVAISLVGNTDPRVLARANRARRGAGREIAVGE
jgi:hypothetical protein